MTAQKIGRWNVEDMGDNWLVDGRYTIDKAGGAIWHTPDSPNAGKDFTQSLFDLRDQLLATLGSRTIRTCSAFGCDKECEEGSETCINH